MKKNPEIKGLVSKLGRLFFRTCLSLPRLCQQSLPLYHFTTFLFLATLPLYHFTTVLYAAGDFAGSVLLRPPSARLSGMAEAAVSLGADEGSIAAFHYNPAAPAYLSGPQISVMGQRGFAEDTYGSIFYGQPTILGSFSAGALYYTLGDIDLINTAGAASTVGAEKDVGLSFNYAEEFFGMLGTGITLKYLNSKLVDTISANAFAFDAGILTRLEDQKLSLGLSVLNIGSDLKYLEALEPMPLTLRIGGSYRLAFQNFGKLILALDFVKERENELKQFIGMDYLWNDIFSIRGGYKMGQDAQAVHAGMGFMITGAEISYGISSGKTGETHSASVSYRFGTTAQARQRTSDARAREKRSREIHRIRKGAKGAGARVAVLGLNSLGAGENTAALLADELYLEFSKKSKAFDVIDPGKVRQVVSEAGINLSQCTDVACLKDLGARLGAEKVVTGLLTKTEGQYSLTVQMVDVETGTIEVTEAVKSSNLDAMEYEIRSIVQSLARSVQ